MKKYTLSVTIFILLNLTTHAQNWLTTGNSGLNNSNFLGTTDNKAVFFKTNSFERGRIQPNGTWKFGVNGNNAAIDSTGILKFSGTGVYQVGNDKYVFQNDSHTKYGLVFKSIGQYEFRDSLANPVFTIDDHGNGRFYGTLKIGTYILPAIDGTSGQVLQTNGTGLLSWSNNNNTVYTAGNGISISGNTISNSARTQWTSTLEKNIYYTAGKVGIGTNTPAELLDVKGLALISSLQVVNNAYINGLTVGRGGNSVSGNSATGENALAFNTTGNYNSANGFKALYSNTSGYGNTASGAFALTSNITGRYNTANGEYALQKNTSGIANTAVGTSALSGNTTGNYNIAYGSNALYENTTGHRNTAIGYNALHSNGIGHHNTAIGLDALYSIGTYWDGGSYNTAIGVMADISLKLPYGEPINNSTAIGYGATVFSNDMVRIGNANVTTIGGQVGWSSFSDGRYKKNIKENVKGLAFINMLHPITYTVDINSLNEHYYKGRENDSVYATMKTDMKKEADKTSRIVYNGFIAQEVEAAAKKLNYNFSGVDKPQTENGIYGLRYGDFVVPLVKAVQELSLENDNLRKTNNDQQKQIDELKLLMLQFQQNFNSCNPCGQQPAMSNELSVMSGGSLAQNIPNPFNNTTTINYTLPQTYSSAKIIIVDKAGKVLKEINPGGKGKGNVNIDASTLAGGAYSYSLYVNGKLIDTKQMVINK